MANTELVKLCVDVVNNPAQVQQFSKGKDIDTQIRKAFFEIMGTDKPTGKDIRRHEVAIFEILEEVLTETYLKSVEEDEFFMRFAETRNLALGDTQEFYVEDDGVLFVSEHAGNHWNISRQKMEGGTTFPVRVKSFAAAVYGDFERFITGRSDFARLIGKVGQAIQNKIYSEVAASFASATANLPTQFTATGTYSEEDLLDVVAHVEAASGTNAVIVGTRKGLAKVWGGLDKQLFSEQMKNELNNTGRVATAHGLTLAQLPQVHKANSFDFAYDDSKLLILPANDERFIKIVFEGEDYVKQVADNTTNVDMSYEYKFITKFGTAAIFGSALGVYNIQ